MHVKCRATSIDERLIIKIDDFWRVFFAAIHVWLVGPYAQIYLFPFIKFGFALSHSAGVTPEKANFVGEASRISVRNMRRISVGNVKRISVGNMS